MADIIYKNRNEVIRLLTELRDEISRRSGLENYKVLKYETIELIASAMPHNIDELGGIKGIGPKKLAMYGEMILALVNGQVENKKEAPKKTAGEVFSVDEFLDQVNDILYDSFCEFYVQGEISGLQERPSGYFFSLADKDAEAVLSCYLPPTIVRGLGFGLEEGMEVKISGALNIWKPKGRLSFVVDTIELVGEGALRKAYEALKLKLEAEGLFDRKRPLPDIIQRIGIITSRSGAVIHDFRNNIIKSGLDLKLYDVRVEGSHAPEEIIKALKYFQSKREEIDVLVVMRGGGSLEDLQAFNHEQVARAVFASGIPVIAAIGHDQDVPIVSLIADKTVSTPTAAAVLVNEAWYLLEERIKNSASMILNKVEELKRKKQYELDMMTSQLLGMLNNLKNAYFNKMEIFVDKVNEIGERIKSHQEYLARSGSFVFREIENTIERFRLRLEAHSKSVIGQNPERILKLGYSLVTDREGIVVKDAEALKKGDEVRANLYKGGFTAVVNNKFK